jgi:hypothetical protein
MQAPTTNTQPASPAQLSADLRAATAHLASQPIAHEHEMPTDQPTAQSAQPLHPAAAAWIASLSPAQRMLLGLGVHPRLLVSHSSGKHASHTKTGSGRKARQHKVTPQVVQDARDEARIARVEQVLAEMQD